MKINGGKLGQSRWKRSAFRARNRCNGRTLVYELAWGNSYEFVFDSRIEDWRTDSHSNSTRRFQLTDILLCLSQVDFSKRSTSLNFYE